MLKSQLGTGTNTTAAPSGTQSATAAADPNANQAGGGSAEGNRGGSSSSSSSTSDQGTSFNQGDGSTSGVARLVATWSGVLGMVVGGMFALL